MKVLNKTKFFTALLLVILMQFIFVSVPKTYAATSPSLGTADSFSVLGGETVTNTGTTTMPGSLGVYPGSEVTGGPTVGPPGTIHAGDTTAQDAQAANTAAFTSLDQGCDTTYAGTKDLVGLNLVPGVYCADAFRLTGTLTLSGSGVWIFKSAADLVTSGTANVVGGDPCNVWWRVVSSATLGTNTSLIGNILASTSITMATGATLNGRAFAQTGQVSLDTNTISGPTCAAAASSTSSSTSSTPPCIASEITTVPTIIESKSISPTSIFIGWGPYAGINTFNVRYGLENGKWLYNTNVTGFSTIINDLPSNQPIWVQIAATNNCYIGTYGEAKLVNSKVLGASVGLPNTGFAPHENNVPWYILVGILVGISIPLVLIKRKYKF